MSNMVGFFTKCSLPLLASFPVFFSIFSITHPLYRRYTEDKELSQESVMLAKQLDYNWRKSNIEEWVLQGAQGVQSYVLSQLTNRSLQSRKLQRLNAALQHNASVDKTAIKKRIKEITEQPNIGFNVVSESSSSSVFKLKQSAVLEQEDVLFLLQVVNQPAVEVHSLELQKEQMLDGAVFVLSDLEMQIYENN